MMVEPAGQAGLAKRLLLTKRKSALRRAGPAGHRSGAAGVDEAQAIRRIPRFAKWAAERPTRFGVEFALPCSGRDATREIHALTVQREPH
jgi:hypothetical protein